jgi:hypothetical protein
MSHQSTTGPRARSGVDSVAHTEHRGTSEGGDRTHADCRLSLDRSRMQDPRPITEVEIPAGAPYTSGHSLEICLKDCHFLPHLGTPGVACRRQSSICKSIHAKRIGPDICSPWPTKTPRGMRRPQNLPRLHTPVVHYLEVESLAHRGGAHLTRTGRRHGAALDWSAGESRTSGSRSTGNPWRGRAKRSRRYPAIDLCDACPGSDKLARAIYCAGRTSFAPREIGFKASRGGSRRGNRNSFAKLATFITMFNLLNRICRVYSTCSLSNSGNHPFVQEVVATL